MHASQRSPIHCPLEIPFFLATKAFQFSGLIIGFLFIVSRHLIPHSHPSSHQLREFIGFKFLSSANFSPQLAAVLEPAGQPYLELSPPPVLEFGSACRSPGSASASSWQRRKLAALGPVLPAWEPSPVEAALPRPRVAAKL